MKSIFQHIKPVGNGIITRLILKAFLLLFIATEMHAQSFPSGFSQVQVTGGLSNPTALAFAPASDGRIFVTEQGGSLRVIKNGTLLTTPALQLTVNSAGERGLIGIVLDPDFLSNKYIYLYYTVPSPLHNRVSRFTLSGDVVASGSEVIVLDLDPLSSATNHNGGAMKFGADGKLYVAVGENANSANSQNLDTYLGKLLRINSDGSVPAGNPFTTGTEQRKRVWAYGFRNPFTFNIQPATGKIFVNDVGQDTWEEINDATTGGRNFGWPAAEGFSSNTSYTNPVYTYHHGSGDGFGCAITGGTFFSPASSNYPSQYGGKYFFLDYCNNWINYIDPSVASPSRSPFATGIGGSSLYLETGIDGNLYYLSRSAGSLYRIIYSGATTPVITSQPASISVAQGQKASFTVSATGTQPLSYQWRKNGVSIAGASASTYTIAAVQPADGGDYTVVVSNSAGSVISSVAKLTVTAPNTSPQATIITPASGTYYTAGDTIRFSGDAKDAEDGTLPASAFTWSVVFHHDAHVHDGPPVAQGTKSGYFMIPVTGETSANVFYRLYLVVTDANGAKDTAYADVLPRTSTITLATQPAGLTLTLDGQPVTAPYAVLAVEGMTRTIGAVTPQTINNVTYEFDHWEQGGAAIHDITVPAQDVTYTAVFRSTALPAAWLQSDVGAVAASGSASYSNGTFTVKGSGADIGGTTDGFYFVYQPIKGDAEIRARVVSVSGTNPDAKAGVMIRESLWNNAKYAYSAVTPGNEAIFQRRTSTGTVGITNAAAGTAPYWVRLVRIGNTFSSYVSGNGNTWTLIGTDTFYVTTNVLVGLAVTSHSDGVLNTSVFDNVTVTGRKADPYITYQPQGITAGAGQSVSFSVTASGTAPLSYQWYKDNAVIAGATGAAYTIANVQSANAGQYTVKISNASGVLTSRQAALRVRGLPSPWAGRDVGTVAAAGSTAYDNGIFTVKGSGADIWDASDEFQFVYEPLNGNGEIRARVTSITNTNDWAKSGVMIRESLDPDSKHAFTALTVANGVAFQRRANTGSSTTNTNIPGQAAPVWLRLVRSGTTFSSYFSTDGSTWQLIATDNITMAASVYAGLAVSSHNDGVINTSQFDNVTVTPSVARLSEDAEPETLSLSVAPVPSAGEVLVNISSLIAGDAGLELKSYTGQTVLRRQIVLAGGDNNFALDLSTLENGIYFLSIQQKTGTTVKRIVIAR